MQKKSYIFIGDLIETEEQLPLNLFDDFYLRQATEEHLTVIKKFLNNYFGILAIKINKYENYYEEYNKEFKKIPLAKKDWKYFIIEHSQNLASQQLQLIFSLSSLDLTILFEVMINFGEGVAHHQLRTINYFHDQQFKLPTIFTSKTITKKSLEELRFVNNLVSNFDNNKFPFIDKALSDFVSIKDISELSPFKILSCFSILELLLTTYKNRTLNESSLSNQLQKKINLINNKSPEKINIQNYFKGSNTNTLETIIKKLYQYRNDIAHGNSSDFKKDLKIFKNQKKNILPFLLDLLKKVLITSLEQPQLIADLKEC